MIKGQRGDFIFVAMHLFSCFYHLASWDVFPLFEMAAFISSKILSGHNIFLHHIYLWLFFIILSLHVSPFLSLFVVFKPLMAEEGRVEGSVIE